jgi:hypothetical protein
MGSIYEALARAENDARKEPGGPRGLKSGPRAFVSIEDVEAALGRLKLDRVQVDRQDLAELKDSLIAIDAAVSAPGAWLQKNGFEDGGLPQGVLAALRELLLGRKRMVLNRIDHSVTRSKIAKLRQLADEVRERRTRSAIHRELNDLEAKDQLVQAEYRLLDDALERLAAAAEGETEEPPRPRGRSAEGT